MGELVELPGLMNAIRSVVNAQVIFFVVMFIVPKSSAMIFTVELLSVNEAAIAVIPFNVPTNLIRAVVKTGNYGAFNYIGYQKSLFHCFNFNEEYLAEFIILQRKTDDSAILFYLNLNLFYL